MSILALAFVVCACGLAIFIPWVGVLAYYLFSVMDMQILWPVFGDSRVQLYIVATTLLGLAISTALKLIDWKRLLTTFNLLMFLLIILVNLSVHLSRYELYIDPTKDLSVPDLVLTKAELLSVFNKSVFFYFVSSLLIDSRRKLEWCVYCLAGLVTYYTLWANKVYLTGEYWLFGHNGRLGGLPGGSYTDENTLAMLFVLATPVLYYIGVARKSAIVRYGIWLFIPLSWHAVFLTSSRGGMVALAVVIIYIACRSFDRKATIAIPIALVLALVFQGGQLLTRVDATVDNPQTVGDPENPHVVDPRLVSWKVATEVILDYPLFGVGVGNFYDAYSDYRDTTPHVVHNTLLQFAAESGVIAGLIYLWFFAIRIPTLKKSADVYGTRNFARGFNRDYLDDLINATLLSFFMVAVFLDLMLYEMLYFLLVINFSKYCLDREKAPKKRRLLDSIYRYTELSPERKT